MAKKFVRGITGIKTINNQDLDTNNVNDLLSDGKHNYIHRKKSDGTEEYHNLTNNIKTIEAEDNGLLTVRNYNNSTNSAKLTVHHDPQKEQKIYSTDHTIEIVHGDNGTGELTNVDVNFEKVQEKLSAGDGLAIENNQVKIKPKAQQDVPANNGFYSDVMTAGIPSTAISLTTDSGSNKYVQIALRESINSSGKIIGKYRFINDNVATDWQEMLFDDQTIKSLIAQKQNTLTSNASIGVDGTGLRQLYTQKQTYTHTNGVLKTHVKSVANSGSVSTLEEEFNFLAKMNKSQTNAEFTLNEHDTAVFEYLIETYGVDNKINVCGSAFTLNGSNLSFNSNGSTYNPHIITFTDIIPTSAINTNP